MSIMRSFMRSKSGFHCSSKVRFRRLCWENDYVEFLVLSQCKDMQRHAKTICQAMCLMNRILLGRSVEFIHPVPAGSEARKWIKAWTRVRQLTKLGLSLVESRFTGFTLHIFPETVTATQKSVVSSSSETSQKFCLANIRNCGRTQETGSTCKKL